MVWITVLIGIISVSIKCKRYPSLPQNRSQNPPRWPPPGTLAEGPQNTKHAPVIRYVGLEAALRRMISVWHQSTTREIRKHTDPSALLSLSRYFVIHWSLCAVPLQVQHTYCVTSVARVAVVQHWAILKMPNVYRRFHQAHAQKLTAGLCLIKPKSEPPTTILL